VQVRRLVGVLTLLAGCDFTFNLQHLKDVPVDGADPDAFVPQDAPGCFGHYGPGNGGLAIVCLDAAPPDDWTPNGQFHTGMFSEMGDCPIKIAQSGTVPDMCVVVARNITLGSDLPTSGGRPLVLVATDTFTLLEGATISVDSRRNAGRNGAGANESDCPPAPNGGGTTGGRGGGGGGSFGTKGGNGGKGQGGAAGGTASQALTVLATVRGGCRGGSPGGASGGGGGASGGAVYIIAGKRVEIRGTIDASGEGGSGGAKSLVAGIGGDAGGGGGSGGLIGIDSPSIMIASTARLLANGGGGGGGGDGYSTLPSASDGGDGSEAALGSPPVFPALGGTGGFAAGKGGDGADSAGAALNGVDSTTGIVDSSGGGGGGGAGFIRFFTPTTVDVQTANISPAPVVN
jgi:hypothetical protein